MWWPWKRRRPGLAHQTGRLADGDVVVPAGRRRFADVLADQQNRRQQRAKRPHTDRPAADHA